MRNQNVVLTAAKRNMNWYDVCNDQTINIR